MADIIDVWALFSIKQLLIILTVAHRLTEVRIYYYKDTDIDKIYVPHRLQ